MTVDKDKLTTPDLVILSLLAERPMHGYEVNAELERRDARDWVAISRPQIYYSLDKLARIGHLKEIKSVGPVIGAERKVLSTSNKGKAALAEALSGEEWTIERDRPKFLTWLALSWQATPDVVQLQLHRRKQFLKAEIIREQNTLRDVKREVGHKFHEAVWMIDLTISQLKLEQRWVSRVELELPHRAPAKHFI